MFIQASQQDFPHYGTVGRVWFLITLADSALRVISAKIGSSDLASHGVDVREGSQSGLRTGFLKQVPDLVYQD
jgi:hypothetical protein